MADETNLPISETSRITIEDAPIEERLRRYDSCMVNGRASKKLNIADLHWVIGFLEGEGSFSYRGRDMHASATQVQRWPLEKLIAVLGGRIYETGNTLGRWHIWDTTGPRAVGIMMSCYSLLSPRRQGQIAKAIANWASRPAHNAYKQRCPRGHPYDKSGVIKRRNGKISNTRGCSICQKAYWANRDRRVVNG